LVIPDSINYKAVASLSNEIREKLDFHRPATLGAAGRIPGITPAALTVLLCFIKDKTLFRQKAS